MKKWLINNKIYFEVTSAILFGGVSLYIGFTANQVSKSQLQIAKLALSPFISIRESYSIDDAGFATDTYIEINNDGAPVHNSSVSSRTFYTISTGHSTVWIPINGYYDTSYRTAAVSGKLADLRGHGNNTSYHDVYVQHLNLSKDNRLNLTELQRVTIVKVVYETRTRETFEDYFLSGNLNSEPWVKFLFDHHFDRWPLESQGLQWKQLEEAYYEILNEDSNLVRDSRFNR